MVTLRARRQQLSHCHSYMTQNSHFSLNIKKFLEPDLRIEMEHPGRIKRFRLGRIPPVLKSRFNHWTVLV